MHSTEMETEIYSDVEKYLRCCSHAMIDGRAWVVGSYGQANAIFSLDRELQNLKLEYSVMEQKNQEIYGIIKKKDNHIYLFPYFGHGIIDINMKSGVQKYFDFGDKCNLNKSFETLDVIEYKGIFYLVPGYFQYPLLKFDGTIVEECSGWKEKLQELVMQKSGILAFQCEFHEDKLYMLLCGCNKIMCTDVETLKISIYDLAMQGHNFERLQYHHGKFWLIPGGKGEIFSFSAENGKEEQYVIPDGFARCQCHTFTNSYYYNDTIWFTPWMADDILILDLKSGSSESLKLPEILLDSMIKEDDPKMEVGFVDGQYLKLLACGGKYHCIIDMQAKKFVEVIDSIIPEEILRENFKAIYKIQNIWTYKQGMLEDFLSEAIRSYRVSEKDKKAFIKNVVKADNSGMKVWKVVKELT